MTCADCSHPGNKHDWETKVCTERNCMCTRYVDANGFDSIYNDMKPYLANLNEVSSKEMVLMQNVKYLRNCNNMEFVLMYMMLVDGMENKQVLEIVKQLWKYKGKLTDFETIRRCKQKLVNNFPDLYGPFEAKLIEEKQYKQSALEEWVTS